MHLKRTCGLLFALLIGSFLPAAAQEACAPGTLGVARTVEIDASAGPKFGFQYHDAVHFLNDKEVVLTFDDGPLRAYTRPVLDALAAECTKATFFVVGRMALADPEMVKEYARRGHTVGTHTWSHANLASTTPLKARAEMEMGFSAVQQAMGKPIAPFFRFPYLASSGSMATHLQNRHIATFSIDVDSKDYRTRDPGAVHRKVMAELARTKKGIILFHDIQPSTARSLPGLLDELKAKGYKVVHLKAKDPATTVTEFDTVVQGMFEKRHGPVAGGSMPLRRPPAFPVSPSTDLRTQPVSTEQPQGTQGEAEGQKPATLGGARPMPGRPSDDWKSGLWRSY